MNAVMDAVAKLAPTVRDGPVPDRAARVSRFEGRLRSPLPQDYREFLEADGRAMFFSDNRAAVPSGGPPREVSLSSLHGVDDNRTTLETANEMYRGRLPPGLIAIGESGGGGDLVCLDVAGPAPGTVFHWDHEREVDATGARQPDYSNMLRIAETFAGLIEAAVPLAGEGKPPPRIKKASLKF